MQAGSLQAVGRKIAIVLPLASHVSLLQVVASAIQLTYIRTYRLHVQADRR